MAEDILDPGPESPAPEEASLRVEPPEPQAPGEASLRVGPPEPEPPPRRVPGGIHLVDCFLELFTYTAYFLQSLETQDPSFEEVARNYLALLNRASAQRARMEVPDEAWDAALFAVCAYADECILCSSWSRKDQWFPVQLQRIHFRTTRAGELFFSRLQALPEDAVEAREVYDYCLALGFKGRLFAPSGEEDLARVRAGNLSGFAEPGELDLPGELFPEAARGPGAQALQPAVRVHHLLVALWILLPVAVFMGLYACFDSILGGMVHSILK